MILYYYSILALFIVLSLILFKDIVSAFERKIKTIKIVLFTEKEAKSNNEKYQLYNIKII